MLIANMLLWFRHYFLLHLADIVYVIWIVVLMVQTVKEEIEKSLIWGIRPYFIFDYKALFLFEM